MAVTKSEEKLSQPDKEIVAFYIPRDAAVEKGTQVSKQQKKQVFARGHKGQREKVKALAGICAFF